MGKRIAEWRACGADFSNKRICSMASSIRWRKPDKMDGSGTSSNRSLCRSRKRVFSFCLVVLAITFALIMLGGQHQHDLLYKWFDPSTGFQSDADTRAARVPEKIPDKILHGEGDYAKVRSNVRDNIDDFLDSVPDLSLEGASDNETDQALPIEGAAYAATKQSIPAFIPVTKSALPTEGVVHGFKSGLKDEDNHYKGLNAGTNPVLPNEGAVNRNIEQEIYRKGVLSIETKQSLSTEGSVHDFQKIVKDQLVAKVPLQIKDKLAFQTTENVITAQTKTETVYYDMCERCCYRYTTIDHDIIKVLNKTLLIEKGCQQRLPDAMIFGVKKGGTTTLKNFLSYHPDIAFTQKELKFFTSLSESSKGLEYYKSRMVYSNPGQISMEKTPAYSHYPKVPPLIKKALPNVKLIIIMRDPVERAVSDYVHMQVTIAKRCMLNRTSTSSSVWQNNKTLPFDCDYRTRYLIEDTFDKSVIDSHGEVRASSQLISKGVYLKDIQRYIQHFKLEQILALDGEAFIDDPYPTVKKVEEFLGIRGYFTRDFFYFDEQKGFFCLNKPIPNNCMSPAKGRPHPVVQEDTLQKLRNYYRPYNEALKQLLNLDLHWSS